MFLANRILLFSQPYYPVLSVKVVPPRSAYNSMSVSLQENNKCYK